MEEEGEKNPILEMSLALIEATAPGALSDPEQAFRNFVPDLRHVVVSRMEKPSVAQLKLLQNNTTFENQNLVQVRKALEQGDVVLDASPSRFAALEAAVLEQAGFRVSVVPLSGEEQAERFREVGLEE